MINGKRRKNDFPSVLNCFCYFLFLIATELKEVFTRQKYKGQEKEIMKNSFFLSTMHDFSFLFIPWTFQEILITFSISYS
jgi:hypothetical protein